MKYNAVGIPINGQKHIFADSKLTMFASLLMVYIIPLHSTVSFVLFPEVRLLLL